MILAEQMGRIGKCISGILLVASFAAFPAHRVAAREPTEYEQYIVELVNRARLDPEAEVARGQATGVGSLANLHFSDRPITNARDSLEGVIAAGAISGLLHLMLLQRGVFGASRLMYCTSAAHTRADVDHAVSALEDALATLAPDLAREAPQLLA